MQNVNQRFTILFSCLQDYRNIGKPALSHPLPPHDLAEGKHRQLSQKGNWPPYFSTGHFGRLPCYPCELNPVKVLGFYWCYSVTLLYQETCLRTYISFKCFYFWYFLYIFFCIICLLQLPISHSPNSLSLSYLYSRQIQPYHIEQRDCEKET